MKREIKFRGLRTDNGGFAYGYVVVDEDGSTYIVNNIGTSYVWDKVIPESVGQFTGLKDYKGIDIYEGDIIKCYRHSNVTHKHEINKVWKDGKYHDETSEVKYTKGAFAIWSELIRSHRAFLYTARPGESFEIIGNIHESATELKEE